MRAPGKTDVELARFVVREDKREVVACQHCHEHMATALKRDEVLDRGVLGEELLVQAVVDRYQDAVPWERMERRARQQGALLSANTLAASAGRVIDLFDPITSSARSGATAAFTTTGKNSARRARARCF